MKVIKTIIDDETYASLARKRKRAGVPSISALFLRNCNELTDEKEAGEIVRQAMKAAAKMDPGSEFKLQDLFTTRHWEGFSKGARLRGGRMFKAEVDGARAGIRTVRKSSSNHQFYVRAA
ncbi:DUF1413 domain-containing protein [uncultured Sphingomonas sp.]|uniref:DUF1413 domain-containing protein n=1 Tax=uncultured Sphingomonas sp. TaxID=158754 RepID=UPI0035C9B209